MVWDAMRGINMPFLSIQFIQPSVTKAELPQPWAVERELSYRSSASSMDRKLVSTGTTVSFDGQFRINLLLAFLIASTVLSPNSWAR